MASTSIPRRPRERERKSDARDSVLRASILDTALELGIGSSSTVANWIFNPVEEADEDVESVLSPSLTYASTATSEESSSSSLNPPHLPLGAGSSSSQSLGKSYYSPDPDAQAHYFRREGLSPVPEAPITHQPSIQFDLRATPEPRAPSPLPPLFKHRKLRKARPDGYDSDGGYISDSSKPDKQKKSKKKDKGGVDGDAMDFESDGGYLSESSKKKQKEKKSKKDKSKPRDGTGTDYESDGGYLSTTSLGSRAKKSKSSKKGSGAASGEESDGGYLSEASAKTRRFFGLSKSPKKKKRPSDPPIPEVIPPVPSLPPLPLPIADKFSRSVTPSSFDTNRSVTPALSDFTVTNRSSHDTIVSDNSSPTTSVDSPQDLPNAFKDAESVRSPSIDVLATFGRRTALGDPAARLKPHPLSNSSSFPSPSPSPIPAVPSITLPRPNLKKNPSLKRTPPQISAPNTSSLAAKHTPVPLILTPPTPLTASHRPSYPPAVPDVLITATFDSQAVWKPTADVPRTPSPHPSASSEYIIPSPNASPLPSPSAPTIPSTGQTLVRPHVLAFYDLPPPSPPPQGPLPTVPFEHRQSRSSDDSAESGPIPNDRSRSRPGTADSIADRKQQPSPIVWRTYSRPGTADGERKQSSPSPLVWTTYNRSGPASAPPTQSAPSPYRSPSRSNLAPPSATPGSVTQPSSPSTAPLFLQRIPSAQRGRESPFPAQPVLPQNESSELVRRTSIVQAASRPQRARNGNGGALSGDAINGIGRERGLRQQEQLDTHWQPRSASALDTRRVSDVDSRQSWVDYDDDGGPDPEHDGEGSHGWDGASGARPLSSESHPDIDSVLSMLRGDGGKRTSRQVGDKAEPRSTFYFDMEDEEDEGYNRYSVWSEGQRPVSIMDAEKSGNARENFVKQVEAMYQKGTIPPVPPLAPAARSGMF